MAKKILIAFLGILALVLLLILFFGPNYAKTYIEDNSQDLVGRQIQIGELDFNGFNGHFLLTDFRLLENTDSAIFIGFDTLYANLALYKLFGGEFLTEALHIHGLKVSVMVKDSLFNFEDLIPETDTTSVDTTIETEDSFINKFTINDIQILNSEIDYDDLDLGAFHDIHDFDIKIPGISFGDQKTTAGMEFGLADGGVFRLNIDYNLDESTYECKMEVEQLNLQPFLVYAQSSLNISDLQGWFSGDMEVSGDLDTPSTPSIKGSMSLNDFVLTDNEGVDAVKLSSLFLNAKEINLVSDYYHFGSFQLNRPEINANVYADGDNLSGLLKEDSDSTHSEGADIDTSLSEPPIHYLLEEFRVENGSINYTDKAIANGPFSYSISDIIFSADSLTEGRNVEFNLSALMNKKGTLDGLFILDPGNPEKGGVFDLFLKEIPIKDFSVFSLNSTAFPINNGRLSFQTKNVVKNRHLNSHIVLKLFKTELGDKQKNIKPEYNVPMKLGIMVLEDPQGLIHIDVPAEGDLEDPEFRYSKLIWKVVMNVLIKAATSPYNLLADAVGASEEDIKFIRFELLQWELGPEQTAQIDLISDILTQKPGILVRVSQVLDVSKEEKLIREYLAKKGFYLYQKYGTDSAQIELDPVDRAKILDIDESADLIAFLQQKTNSDSGIVSFVELANTYVSDEAARNTHKKILHQRIENIRKYIATKELSERFIVTENWTDDANRNKVRFEMMYEVKEE
jgi:hypothetical protein